MSRPLVSVVVPVYNSKKYIVDALDSVIAQTFRPIEVIIVDDGSTDGSDGVIRAYIRNLQDVSDTETRETVEHAKYPEQAGQLDDSDSAAQQRETGCDVIALRYIYQDNGGPSRARNSGIRAAKGEYVAFLDADDSWTSDKLERQISLFEQAPAIDVVFCNVMVTKTRDGRRETFDLFDRQGLDKGFFGHEYIVEDPLEKVLRRNFMLTPAVIARRACFGEDFLFNERMRHAEDWELWLRLSLRFRFGYVKDVCVHVRDEGDGLCAQSDHMLLSALKIREDFVRENLSHISRSISAGKLSMQLKKHYKWAGHYFMSHGNNRSARDFYGKALKIGFDLKTAYFYFRTCLSR
jgi:glycosyltransferase involved in cell wall biosynthesis